MANNGQKTQTSGGAKMEEKDFIMEQRFIATWRNVKGVLENEEDAIGLRGQKFVYTFEDQSTDLFTQVKIWLSVYSPDCWVNHQDACACPMVKRLLLLHCMADEDNYYEDVRLMGIRVDASPKMNGNARPKITGYNGGCVPFLVYPLMYESDEKVSRNEWVIPLLEITEESWKRVGFAGEDLRVNIIMTLMKDKVDPLCKLMDTKIKEMTDSMAKKASDSIITYMITKASDLKLVSNEGKNFETNSILLAARSPHFELFVQQRAFLDNRNGTYKVYAPSITVQWLVNYLHFGKLERFNYHFTPEQENDVTKASIFDIIKYVHYWDLQELRDYFELTIKFMISENNCVRFEAYCRLFSFPKSLSFILSFKSTMGGKIKQVGGYIYPLESEMNEIELEIVDGAESGM